MNELTFTTPLPITPGSPFLHPAPSKQGSLKPEQIQHNSCCSWCNSNIFIIIITVRTYCIIANSNAANNIPNICPFNNVSRIFHANAHIHTNTHTCRGIPQLQKPLLYQVISYIALLKTFKGAQWEYFKLFPRDISLCHWISYKWASVSQNNREEEAAALETSWKSCSYNPQDFHHIRQIYL